MDNTERFTKLIDSFEAAITAGLEKDIHEFLICNSWILKSDTYYGSYVISKFPLSNKYIPDFIVVGFKRICRSLRPLVTFVEIERANEPLYTKSGDPTSFLTHAIQQVQDWKAWVSNNRQTFSIDLMKKCKELADETQDSNMMGKWNKYIRRDFIGGLTYGFTDRYLLIAGRRTEMTVNHRMKLAAHSENLDKIRIVTYDCIIENLIHSFTSFSANEPWKVNHMSINDLGNDYNSE